MSPAPNNYDGLLSRLNALKGRGPSPPQPLAGIASSTEEKDDRDIAARFRRLASGQSVSPKPASKKAARPPVAQRHTWETLPDDTPHNDEDDQTLEELLRDLGEPKEFDAAEEDEMRSLLQQAKEMLPEDDDKPDTNGPGRPEDAQQPKVTGLGIENAEQHQHDSDAEDDEAADEYISKVLAELDVERNAPGFLHDKEEEHEKVASNSQSADTTSRRKPPDEGSTHTDDDGDGGGDLELPSTPSALPDVATQIHDIASSDEKAEDDLAARLASLSLPSTPSGAPKPKKNSPADLRARILNLKKPSVKPTLRNYTDEEIESWCVICNNDATIKCVGCDDDLYCQKCWDDGHRGPEAGLEEKSHKAVLFNPGEDGEGGKRKRLAA